MVEERRGEEKRGQEKTGQDRTVRHGIYHRFHSEE